MYKRCRLPVFEQQTPHSIRLKNHKLRQLLQIVCLSLKQGHAASIRMGALRYIECSAKTTQGVKEAFEAVTSFAVLPNDRIKKSRSFRRLFGKE